VSYVLRFPDVQGRLDAAKARALGVPPGPLFAKLKAGQAVQVPGGRQVLARECVEEGAEGGVVAVLACPDTRYAASLADALASQTLPPVPSGKQPAGGGGPPVRFRRALRAHGGFA